VLGIEGIRERKLIRRHAGTRGGGKKREPRQLTPRSRISGGPQGKKGGKEKKRGEESSAADRYEEYACRIKRERKKKKKEKKNEFFPSRLIRLRCDAGQPERGKRKKKEGKKAKTHDLMVGCHKRSPLPL